MRALGLAAMGTWLCKESPRASEDGRPSRLLEIVRYLYWNGSASLDELSTALAHSSTAADTAGSVSEQDIALLMQHGLPMSVDECGRWRIDVLLGGFALGLTRAEASAVWAWCVAIQSSDRLVDLSVSSAHVSDALVVVLAGLQQFHKGSEMMGTHGVVSTRPQPSTAENPMVRLDVTKLTGEARLLARRLQIIDLIEGQKARNTSELATILDVCQRTVQDDLGTLRNAGLKIRYCRDRYEFRMEGFKAYLADHLMLPMAAAILAVFEPASSTCCKSYASITLRLASQKIAKGVCLIFANQIDELRALAASYGVVIGVPVMQRFGRTSGKLKSAAPSAARARLRR